MDKLSTVDRYPSDSRVFSSHGCDLLIENELVADAFASLSLTENGKKRPAGYRPTGRYIKKFHYLLHSIVHLQSQNCPVRKTGFFCVSWYFRYADPASVVLMRTDCLHFTELVGQCLDVSF